MVEFSLWFGFCCSDWFRRVDPIETLLELHLQNVVSLCAVRVTNWFVLFMNRCLLLLLAAWTPRRTTELRRLPISI